MKKLIIRLILLLIFLIIILSILLTPISKNANILILDNKNDELIYINNNNKTTTTNLNNIDDKYISYLLFIEDKEFYNHHGFSIKRIFKSIINNINNNTLEGASTITQQYIKNTYLNNKKILSRKIKEIYLSIILESKLTKDEILEKYLSCIYFGNNIYGINHASKYYYNKNLNELNDKEFISLIALINSPTIYSNNIKKWNEGKNKIAEILYKNNILDINIYNTVISDIKLNQNENYINSNLQYFIDQVLIEFKNKNINSGFNELITIYTDYERNLESLNNNINYSLISINKNGYITSCIGGNNYYESTFNIAINGKRDIGSTIKPILYYELIKCGLKDIIFNSNPFSFKYNNEIITINNSSNIYYNTIDLNKAIAVSDNIYAIKSHLNIGMNTLANHLKKYNICAKALPSLALGSIGMSLYELISIYYQFFNDGYYTNPIFIKGINYNNKNYMYSPNKYRINNKDICNEIKLLLKAPFNPNIKGATCGNIANKLHTNCYGKTGTTDYDSYILGFNEDNLIAVWSGNISNKLINNSHKKLPKELFYKAMNLLVNPSGTN